MTKRQIKQVLSLVGLVISAGVYFFQQERSAAAPVPSTEPVVVSSSTGSVLSTATSSTAVTPNATVVHVADGDTVTVQIDGEKDEVKVRLLAINTPESVDPRRPVQCFGKEASNYTKVQLTGKRVFLREDPQADNVDKYGRLLRIVILPDGTNYNEQLVERGYAQAYVDFPLSREQKTRFRQLEVQARTAQVGLWNPSTCNGNL